MSGTGAGLAVLLVLIGAGWGLTQPLVKIAVSGGAGHFGLVFWQLVIGSVLLGGLTRARGKGLPVTGAHLRLYVVLALVGTVIPNSASFAAARVLPAGVISILLSTVPLLVFPVALVLRIDRFSATRLAGLALGFGGVLALALPEASLPERGMVAMLPLGLVAPFFYALEGNIVSRWGTCGLDPIQVLAGASVAGTVLALPLAVGTGQFVDPRGAWGAPGLALVLSATIHALVYSAYVWLVGRAGSVFAAQVSYFVTLFGVGWSMLILGERYSGWVWAAMALMMLGLALVQPRPKGLGPLAAAGEAGDR